jgi:methyl-accepting chemotaxis protein
MPSEPSESQQPKVGEASTEGGETVIVANEVALERFARAFETSARRWELVVYPALFAFIILAGYGFFLIFSLTQDMHTLAERMDPRMSQHMGIMSDRMTELSTDISSMSQRIDQMTVHIDEMRGDTASMTQTMTGMSTDMAAMSSKMDALAPMLANMTSMNENMQAMNSGIQAMTGNTAVMTRDMGAMSHNFARPMSFMNSFFPW